MLLEHGIYIPVWKRRFKPSSPTLKVTVPKRTIIRRSLISKMFWKKKWHYFQKAKIRKKHSWWTGVKASTTQRNTIFDTYLSQAFPQWLLYWHLTQHPKFSLLLNISLFAHSILHPWLPPYFDTFSYKLHNLAFIWPNVKVNIKQRLLLSSPKVSFGMQKKNPNQSKISKNKILYNYHISEF